MGYSPTQSAYYCLDLTTHRLYVSRHVQFLEHIFPFSESTNTIPSVTSLVDEWAPLTLPTLSPVPSTATQAKIPALEPVLGRRGVSDGTGP